MPRHIKKKNYERAMASHPVWPRPFRPKVVTGLRLRGGAVGVVVEVEIQVARIQAQQLASGLVDTDVQHLPFDSAAGLKIEDVLVIAERTRGSRRVITVCHYWRVDIPRPETVPGARERVAYLELPPPGKLPFNRVLPLQRNRRFNAGCDLPDRRR